MKAGACRILAVLVLGLASSAVATGQEAPAKDQPPPTVSQAKRVVPEGEQGADEGLVCLNQRLRVTVPGLADYARRSNLDLHKAVLYLDDTATNVHPEPGGVDGDTLTFLLERRKDGDAKAVEESRTAWARVLGRPTSFTRRVSVAIGLENQPPLPTEVRGDKALRLILVPWGWLFWVSAGGFVLALFLFGVLARVSDIIRDAGPEPAAGGRKSYSLGRTQMAFWFFLVLASYLMICLITREQTAIPNSVLGLMGIAAVTALCAAAVDTSKRAAAQAELPKYVEQQAAAQAAVAAAAASGVATAPVAAQTHLTALDAGIREAQARLGPSASQGFWRDLLSDADGISLHRFQIVVWTIVLGAVFVIAVYDTLAMPEFDNSLLLLMGISAGAYVGFKIPEKAAAS